MALRFEYVNIALFWGHLVNTRTYTALYRDSDARGSQRRSIHDVLFEVCAILKSLAGG